MVIKVKKLDPNAQIPKKAHESDFGYDVVAVSCKQINDNVYEYGLGLAFEIDRQAISIGRSFEYVFDKETADYENYAVKDYWIEKNTYDYVNLSIDFRPRSSVYKTGLVLCNCVGTIDELYRGEVKAFFYKVAPGEIYKVGDRIGQIKLGFTLPMEFKEVEELDMETERGTGGFGSSGR